MANGIVGSDHHQHKLPVCDLLGLEEGREGIKMEERPAR